MEKLRFRFQLRTLLVAMVVPAVFLGLFVNWWQSRQNFVLLTMGGSQAMEPFISGRTYLAIDMNAYRRARPTRWEAVVFRLQPPARAGRAPTARILRVIGLPGEAVSFSDGMVVIDGQPLEPPSYVPPHLQNVRYHLDVPDSEVVPHPYTVPDGCYYLLGDNPDAANDSRVWGALPKSEILSRYPTQGDPVRVWPRLGIGVLVVLAVLAILVRGRNSKKTDPIPAPPRDTA